MIQRFRRTTAGTSGHRSAPFVTFPVFMFAACLIVFSFAGSPLPAAAAGEGSGAADSATGTPPVPAWTVGYWFWDSYGRPHFDTGLPEPELLYVQAGSMSSSGRYGPVEPSLRWPGTVPKAGEYFVLLRVDDPVVPSLEVIPVLARKYRSVKAAAARTRCRVAGFQLDFDCPTRLLGDYAVFLKALREALPAEDRLSITALLDWFGPGTAVKDLMPWVDEFVPQFYDTGLLPKEEESRGIAEPIDALLWAPRFNAMGKPYRLGISVFGRMSVQKPGSGKERFSVRDSLLGYLRERELVLASRAKSAAGERVLRFTARMRPSKFRAIPGEAEEVEMVLPTAESLKTAYEAAKAFGGACSGVIFFRWPSESESMVLRPDEVNRILAGGAAPSRDVVTVEDGFCAAVQCSNLYVKLADRFPEKPVRVRVLASGDLDYFLPSEEVKAVLSGKRSIDVWIPAFAGVPAIFAGRAVSTAPVTFAIEEKP